jgi:hypothetical protein
MKGNLGPGHLPAPLWFGSAIHYALEDYHGYKHFPTAGDAFRAYCIATAKQHIRELPSDAEEHYKLGGAMMDYYTNYWEPARKHKLDQTFWLDDQEHGKPIPQVEVNFEIEVPIHEHPLLESYTRAHGADCVLYRGTIDRVSVDDLGRLWVVEYKTAKRAEHMHYQTDPQVTTYAWACSHIYNRPVAGIVYMQFVKDFPAPPRILSTGKISTAANLATSSLLYREALTDLYGDAHKAPEANRNFLTNIMIKENEDMDRYVHREYIYRNEAMCAAEAQKILLELEDMLNPDLPLYPNPTRDCSRMCSFLGACVSFDDGGDWEGNLATNFSQRDQAADRMWRRRLPSPEILAKLNQHEGTPDLESMQIKLQSMDPAQREAVERGEEAIAFTFNM